MLLLWSSKDSSTRPTKPSPSSLVVSTLAGFHHPQRICRRKPVGQKMRPSLLRERREGLLGWVLGTPWATSLFWFSPGAQAPAKGKRDRQFGGRKDQEQHGDWTISRCFLFVNFSLCGVPPPCLWFGLASETQEAEATPNPGPPAVSRKLPVPADFKNDKHRPKGLGTAGMGRSSRGLAFGSPGVS